MTDLAGMAAQSNLSSAISVAVARKALDAAAEQGGAAVALIRAAGLVGTGRGAVAEAAGAGEPGRAIDVTA